MSDEDKPNIWWDGQSDMFEIVKQEKKLSQLMMEASGVKERCRYCGQVIHSDSSDK